jgi:hypothetical protein
MYMQRGIDIAFTSFFTMACLGLSVFSFYRIVERANQPHDGFNGVFFAVMFVLFLGIWNRVWRGESNDS